MYGDWTGGHYCYIILGLKFSPGLDPLVGCLSYLSYLSYLLHVNQLSAFGLALIVSPEYRVGSDVGGGGWSEIFGVKIASLGLHKVNVTQQL